MNDDQKGEGKEDIADIADLTAAQFVETYRDFSKTSMQDLEAAFDLLRKRYPGKWSYKLQIRAKEFNRNINTIKQFHDEVVLPKHRNSIDDISVEYEKMESEPDSDEKEITATNLMVKPETWSMNTSKDCRELAEVLRHFVISIPYEGRPFVRKWINELQPCLLHWISLSNTEDYKMTKTLKHFLAAFGQPGVVSSLSDKGASLLEAMQDAAHSVEARGRGEVEDYYWKQKYQSTLVKKPYWKDLSSLKNSKLQKSQLEHLPKNWLVDSRDWAHVLAHAVSPEISEAFEKMVIETLAGTGYGIKAGPPKTLARSLAKCHEYKSTLREDNPQRFENFVTKFEEIFEREPSRVEDYVWNIVDFARCSIDVPSAKDVLNVVKIFQENENFKVLSLKNGYGKNFKVKGSGYRDLKLLVEVKFDNLVLKGIPNVEPETILICELQILCEKWLVNKKTTSFSYKILRARTLRALLKDFAKYRGRGLQRDLLAYATLEETIKHGWRNLAKIGNLSVDDANRLLSVATIQGWSSEGVSYLIQERGADIGFRFPDAATDTSMITPLISAAKNGRDKLVKLLLEYNSDINAVTGFNSTALHWAVQAGHAKVVQTLLQARCDTQIQEQNGDTAQDIASRLSHRDQILSMLKGEDIKIATSDRDSQANVLLTAASEGHLCEYFDLNNVKVSALSDVFLSKTVVTSQDSLLLLLYFGGQVQKADKEGLTALHWAAKYSSAGNIQLIIDAKADLNAVDSIGARPIWYAIGVANKERFFPLFRAGANCCQFFEARAANQRTYWSEGLKELMNQGTEDDRKKITQILSMGPDEEGSINGLFENLREAYV